MGTRLLISIFILCGGLFGFLSTWSEQFQPEPTLWFHQLAVSGPELDLTSEIDALGERRIQECNEVFVAELRRKRERLARGFTPRETLLDIAYRFNAGLSAHQANTIVDGILASSARHDVDPFLVAALISQESRYKPYVQSPGGAVGLGQLLPGTAASLGVNPHDPVQNVEGCVKYLAVQLERWSHCEDPVALALASYNAGPGAVEKYGGIPPYQITQSYVRKISHRRVAFRAEASKVKDRWIASNGPVMKDLFGAPVPERERVLSQSGSKDFKS